MKSMYLLTLFIMSTECSFGPNQFSKPISSMESVMKHNGILEIPAQGQEEIKNPYFYFPDFEDETIIHFSNNRKNLVSPYSKEAEVEPGHLQESLGILWRKFLENQNATDFEFRWALLTMQFARFFEYKKAKSENRDYTYIPLREDIKRRLRVSVDSKLAN